jgi:hypothetical protein
MAEILRCYKRQHTLKRVNVQLVHLVFSAALVCTYDVVCNPSSEESSASLRQLQFICHALGEIGQSFGNAQRALEVIILVKSEWQKVVLARRARKAGLKRRSVSVSTESHGSSSKRRHYAYSTTSEGTSADSPGGLLLPTPFDAYQMLCDNPTGNPGFADLMATGIAEVGPTQWDDFNLAEFMTPFDWLENLPAEGGGEPGGFEVQRDG